MKKISNKISLLFVLILSFTLIVLVGCAPKGKPEETLNAYYENIKNNNAEGAYETLSEQSKKDFKKEDFIKWQEAQQKTSLLKEAKVEKINESKDKELNGIKFKNVVEFNVSEKVKNLIDNKDESLSYKRYVVNDNGSWKVYRDKENGKERIAQALNRVAWIYMASEKQDLNQAATILNDALKENKDYIYTYYSLGNVYSRLGRYDESISNINNYISKEKDSSKTSDAYNILGVDYEGKGEYKKAKEYYSKAIELNSNNQYAKTNLERVKQY
ncbi:tetratricopeptide repeat protein [Clostridium botulinum]|uniref:tetratricopeptide repeat protein n=1 Tax=Clostridium botulinum TaxID=1491 RepID=UPI00249113FD|nr:tetratricopeptide repeat protein [Clostridium botulinum]BDB02131.1 hypothetical protein CBOS2020_22050 [Clostridium botulinum]